MRSSYSQQKSLELERRCLKTMETQFYNIIKEGTNCSSFETEIILDKAKECFGLGEYSELKSLKPGQIVWMGVSEDAPSGKPLKDCLMVRVILNLHSSEDLELKENKQPATEIRQQQILRICIEAKEQGALLTQEDLAQLLGCDPRTIRNDISYLKKKGILVASRGMQKDIGPCVTHKIKAVELFLKGKEHLEIARDLKHSLKAVERYITTFCRVVFCQKRVKNNLKTALMVGISVSAVNDYLEVAQKYCQKKCYQNQLQNIEKTGKLFWDAQDFKKKVSPKERGSK